MPFRNISVEVKDLVSIAEDRIARVVRTFEFSTSGNRSYTIPSFEFELPIEASDIELSLDQRGSQPGTVEIGSYATRVRFPGLSIHGSQSVSCRFLWRDFVVESERSQTDIRLSLPFPFSYSAAFRPVTRGLLPNLRITLSPSDCSLIEPYVVAEDGHVLVPARKVPTGARLVVSLHLSRRGVPELPALKFLASNLQSPRCFDGLAILFVQHLLSDFLALFGAFLEGGLKPERSFVIGIPYSTKRHVVEHLRDLGVVVEAPTEYPFEPIVRVVLARCLALCQQQNLKLLVVEDGGYVSPLLESDPVFSMSPVECVGVVEQTRNGIWLYEAAVGSSPRVPLVAVAESQLKSEWESPLIGRAVVSNIERLLNVTDRSLQGKRVLLLGCGDIGREILKELGRFDCDVTISEPKPERWPQPTQHVRAVTPEAMVAEIQSCDVIIGASGEVPFNTDQHFAALRHGAVLVNASSKLREFDAQKLKKFTDHTTLIPGVGREHHLLGNKGILFLANGFPVNFFETESVPGESIQPILGLLLMAASHLATSRMTTKGKLPFPQESEVKIREACVMFGIKVGGSSS